MDGARQGKLRRALSFSSFRLTRRGRLPFYCFMRDLAAVPRGDEDSWWAVVATVGRAHRIAEIYRSRAAALEDRAWRAQQVRAYEDFLRRSQQPVPHYSVTPIRRSDLPRKWRPLPALGFLRGEFI